ncbi:E3 ubiquitin-protein ligase NRDP1-like [Paramacrobiotus metropolitanus]|uniref:E3 ubiquitin-protein ligase NRDP1-like n=1 Tax=Paramacrobiotus metropolitanus TaxID=2943436 RepID=UPI002445827B|nr:E3 ubiquitin-protein ligase NRDP1-like [Paramacrobiotus metropolitanus]
MGYDINRFEEGSVDKDLLVCPICMDVFDHPVELPDCQHIFCQSCIARWLQGKSECPLDRNPVKQANNRCYLRPPNRTIAALLEKLRIRCSYADGGCSFVSPLSQIDKHQRYCKHKKNSKFAKEEPANGGAYRDTSSGRFNPGPHDDQRQRGTDREQTSAILVVVMLVVVLIFAAFRHR